jgi:hypothetical protein
MKSLTLTWIIFLWVTAGCSVSEDPCKMMIDHILADTTLVAELWCDTCNQITDYSVHPIVIFGWGELMCLDPGLDPEKIDAYWLANKY